MIEFYGKVQIGQPDGIGNTNSQSNCSSACFQLEDCVVAYRTSAGICMLYNYPANPNNLTVIDLKNDKGSVVAIKTDYPENKCPSRYTDVTFTIPSPQSEKYGWSLTSSGWKLQSCQDGWHYSERRAWNMSACIRGRLISQGITKKTAIGICKDDVNSVLIGPATVEESRLMQKLQRNLTPKLDAHFWVDGVRNRKVPDVFTNFYWSDGFTTGNAALVDPKNAELSGKNPSGSEDCLAIQQTDHAINDVDCKLDWFTGMFCGYKLDR